MKTFYQIPFKIKYNRRHYGGLPKHASIWEPQSRRGWKGPSSLFFYVGCTFLNMRILCEILLKALLKARRIFCSLLIHWAISSLKEATRLVRHKSMLTAPSHPLILFIFRNHSQNDLLHRLPRDQGDWQVVLQILFCPSRRQTWYLHYSCPRQPPSLVMMENGLTMTLAVPSVLMGASHWILGLVCIQMV